MVFYSKFLFHSYFFRFSGEKNTDHDLLKRRKIVLELWNAFGELLLKQWPGASYIIVASWKIYAITCVIQHSIILKIICTLKKIRRNAHVAWSQVFTCTCIKSAHLLFFVAIMMSRIFILCHRILHRNIFCAHACTFSRGRKIFVVYIHIVFFQRPILNIFVLDLEKCWSPLVSSQIFFFYMLCSFIFWFCFWYCFKYSFHHWCGHDWMNIICQVFLYSDMALSISVIAWMDMIEKICQSFQASSADTRFSAKKSNPWAYLRRELKIFYSNWFSIQIFYSFMFFLLYFDIALNISVIAGVDMIEKNWSTLTSLVCWHTICCKNVKSVSCLLNTQSLVCLRRDLKIFFIVIGFLFKIFISFMIF